MTRRALKMPSEPIRLTLPLPPSVNHLYKRYGSRVVKSEAGRAFVQEVQLIGRGCELLEGDVSITAILYRSRKVGDIDNFNKALLDALQGVAYTNDRQVVELHLYLRTSAANPRVEVFVDLTEEMDNARSPF